MKRLSCATVVDSVTAYLDGALDDDTRPPFEEHLRGCDCCARFLDQIRTTITLLGDLPPDPLPSRARHELLAAFRTSRRAHQ